MRRPTFIPEEIEDLRWELAFQCKDKPERREEILKILEEYENGEGSVSEMQE